MSHTFSLKAKIIKCRIKKYLKQSEVVILSPAGCRLDRKAAKQIQIQKNKDLSIRAIKNSFNLSSIHEPVSTNIQIKKRSGLTGCFFSHCKAFLDEVTTFRLQGKLGQVGKSLIHRCYFPAALSDLLFGYLHL